MKNAYVTKRLATSGYVAVTKPLARKLYEEGKAITLAGNNVNSFHIFNGWNLGCTVKKEQVDRHCAQGHTDEPSYMFESLVNNFLFYLDNELGKYPVFYVKREEIPV